MSRWCGGEHTIKRIWLEKIATELSTTVRELLGEPTEDYDHDAQDDSEFPDRVMDYGVSLTLTIPMGHPNLPKILQLAGVQT